MADSKPKILVDGYNSQAAPVPPPAAAVFNKGATTRAEIQNAADQRRAHSAALSKPAKFPGRDVDPWQHHGEK